MENTNPFVPAPPNGLHARITQELDELRAILAMIDSLLENIVRAHIPVPPPVPFEQLLDDFMNPPNELLMDDFESDTESYDTPFVSPFLNCDEESDDGEVINELNECGNAWNFHSNGIINIIDGNDLEFPCMIGFRRDNFIHYDLRHIHLSNGPHNTRLRNFNWSKVPPILELSQRDLRNGLRYSHKKNKLVYKNCLNVESEVLIKHIGSNEEDANMMNKICKEVAWGAFLLR
nr:putative UPF0481 protein At3g02645 [Tanacetum cinerariifolium]